MLRALAFAIFVVVSALAGHVRADDGPVEFPAPTPCFAPLDDTGIGIEPAEKAKWSACEKWVWSCIRLGQEANLFLKQCLKPRQGEATAPRKLFRLAAFVDPDQYKASNALSDKFLITILTQPAYVKSIAPVGVRIFGAYFGEPVNLENVTTAINLVLDATMARQGLRLTNFKSEKNLSLDGSNIRGAIFLMRARIDGSVFMEKSVLDSVDLNDAHIGSSFEATGSLFNGELRLNRASIAGKVIVTKSRLTTLVAWNSHIGSSLEMRLADVRVGIDLTGSTVDGDVRMQDVTFGRQTSTTPRHCDWNPAVETDHILSSLKELLPPQMFDAAWKETVSERSLKNGVPEPNVCAVMEASAQPAVRHNALLHDMRIKGLLCVMDVTGEIEGPAPPGSPPPKINTISFDGTEAGKTILGWKPSVSDTEWRAVNFKTEYLLINLNSQPNVHYVDNLDVRVITLLKSNQSVEPAVSLKLSDEHLVKKHCDVTPNANNTDATGDREAQNRIIKFFSNDKSGSAQPFAAVVTSLESSGINTVHLKKALSKLKYRNLCASSQLMKNWQDLPWSSVKDRMSTVTTDEASKFFLDGLCTAGLFTYANLVSYGHEPHRLAYASLILIGLFWLLLKFDRTSLEAAVPSDPLALVPSPHHTKFDLIYAIDNFIPIKTYRIERERAERPPCRRWLRAYRAFHRAMGMLFVVAILLFVYRIAK